MKLIILLIFVLIVVGCADEGKYLAYKCAKACLTEEEYSIPAIRSEVQQICYNSYYYGGKEAILQMIEDCEN